MEKSQKRQDAIALLMSDHKEVKQMFKEFETLCKEEASDEEKTELAAQICSALTIHTQIEEDIFYPAVRKAIDDDDLLDEAAVEHASAKELISQLESMEAGDEYYDAKVTVLGEYVDHHIKEEEGEMFPKTKKSELDLAALGDMMAQRKEELQDDMQLTPARNSRKSGKSPSSGKPMSH